MSDHHSSESYILPESEPSQQSLSSENAGKKKVIDKNQIRKSKSLTRKPIPPVRQKTKIIQKYFTDGKQVTDGTVIDLDKKPNPFDLPKPEDVPPLRVFRRECRALTCDREVKKLAEKKVSAQGRLNLDLFNRLYVKVPPPDGTKTVLDYDHDFHRAVEGRPIADDKFNIRDYVETVRNTLRTKIILGYREDDIAILNENLRNEQKNIEQVTRDVDNYVKKFEEFLARDNTCARTLLKEAEDMSTSLYNKKIEHKTLMKSYTSVKAGLYSAEKKWSDCKKYQKFLFYISPLHWKKANAQQVPDMEHMSASEEEHMFDEAPMDSSEVPVETMIENFRRDCEVSVPPKIYFNDPDEVLEVFKYMEAQNMNYLLHAEELALPVEKIANNMNKASDIFDTKIDHLHFMVGELSKAIEYEENRAIELEKMATSLIHNQFKELITADEILNLHVFIEDCYESSIGPNNAHLNILHMMNSIEKKYREEVLKLDRVPSDLVEILEGSSYGEQRKMLKLASEAVKKFKELDILTKQLKRAYAPMYEKGRGKETKGRSKLVSPPKPKPQPKPTMKPEDEEFLEFFTDFCKYTDDPALYGQLPAC